MKRILLSECILTRVRRRVVEKINLVWLGVALSVPPGVLAQAPETCSISPQPPAFEAGVAEDRLHALPHAPRAAAHTALHGQGVYGEETVYFSHLAVFMGSPESHPHNFQVILEVAFEDPNAQKQYQVDRAQHGDVIYTATPPVFDQTALITQHTGRQSLRHLPNTTVWRGHFEQQGRVPILSDINFEIKRLVHFREFLLGGAKLEKQSYLLFGQGKDIFLSHLLSAPADFDQILAVEFKAKDVPTDTMSSLIKDLLAQGLYVHLPARQNATTTRLRAGDKLTCSLETGTRALPIAVDLHITAEPYCESGEFDKLVISNFNSPRRCEE